MTVERASRDPNRLLVGIGFATFIVFGLNAGLMGVAWPSIRDTYGVGDDAYGAMTMIATVGSLAITFGSGSLIERLGIGLLLLGSCLLGAAGYVGFALAPSWWAAVALQLVAAIGIAAINPGINTYFATHHSAGRMNWLHACFGLGATLGPMAMTGILSAGHSWRWGYAGAALTYLLLGASFAWTLHAWPRTGGRPDARPPVPDPGEEQRADAPGPRARPTWALPAVWLSAALFFTFTGVETSTGQWPYTLFTEARGIDPRTAGIWISAYYMSMTVGRAFFGVVVDRMRASVVVRLCMGGAIAGALLIWVGSAPALGFAGLALTGFCVAPLFPVLTSNTPQRLGRAHAARAIGYQITAVKLGLAAIPALGGVLAARWGTATIGPFLFAIAVAAFLLHEAAERTASVQVPLPEPIGRGEG
ncbi:MAG: MFS transporter [Anaerolineae bacterium]|nr:MFS transporter [Anaerolineae bacterium]